MGITFFRIFTIISLLATTVLAQTAYANDFVDPDYILAGNFGDHTQRAQLTVVQWAKSLAKDGPWSVTSKPVTPPSGDKHDYLSWAPYWWPDCSKVGNTTALSPEDVWTKCPYVNKDGQFNPDARQVNDVGNFQDMSEAVFYGAIAWTLGSADKATFETNTVKFIRAWFLDAATKMNPNLKFGQMQRGPDGQTGTHTGILDLKSMAKVTTAVLILRKGKSTAWTTDLDNQLIDWSRQYISWLETTDIAVEEGKADNNHGTFYYNQLAALKILVNDLAGAKTVTNTYFTKQYLTQIDAKGDQPLESSRTRPYHYRAYNLAGMITNARLAKYADSSSNAFQMATSTGSNIKTALDYAMTISAASSKEADYTAELYPDVAAVAAAYGDADGKYLKFLKAADPDFIAQPYILWDQPFAVGETSGKSTTRISTSSVAKATSTSKSKSSSTSDSKDDDATDKTSGDARAMERPHVFLWSVCLSAIIVLYR